jgi:rSAM/selenodomain-associated transferase 1
VAGIEYSGFRYGFTEMNDNNILQSGSNSGNRFYGASGSQNQAGLEPGFAARSAIAIFARAPIAGEVKTRLIAAPGPNGVRSPDGVLSPQAVCALYAAMLRDTFQIAQRAAAQRCSCDVIIAHTPDSASDFFATGFTTFLPESAENAQFWPQGEGDLAARLLHFLKESRVRGYERVLIIGSDAPDLPTKYLLEAFEKLQNHALVFGPASDGGFYLIGASQTLPPGLLGNIAWSTPRVLESVLANAARLELDCALLTPWPDVDEWSDLQALIARLRSGQSTAPQTRRALALLRLIES